PHRLMRLAEDIVLPLIQAIPSPMEREHFVQVAARTLGLSSEAVRESIARLPKQPITTDTARVADSTHVKKTSSPRELRSEQLLAVIHAYPGTPLAERVKLRYGQITEAELPLGDVPPEPVLFAIEQTFGEDPAEDAADELLHAFETAVIREAYQEAVANLRRAEAAGDDTRIKDAQDICAKLGVRLAALG